MAIICPFVRWSRHWYLQHWYRQARVIYSRVSYCISNVEIPSYRRVLIYILKLVGLKFIYRNMNALGKITNFCFSETNSHQWYILCLHTYDKRHGTSYLCGIDSCFNVDSPSISKMHQLWYESICWRIFGKYTDSVCEKRDNFPQIMCSHLQWSRRMSWDERGQGNQHVHFSLWDWGWHHLSITCVNGAWTEALFERKLQQWLSISKLIYIYTHTYMCTYYIW